jgi:hypothetical protein
MMVDVVARNVLWDDHQLLPPYINSIRLPRRSVLLPYIANCGSGSMFEESVLLKFRKQSSPYT